MQSDFIQVDRFFSASVLYTAYTDGLPFAIPFKYLHNPMYADAVVRSNGGGRSKVRANRLLARSEPPIFIMSTGKSSISPVFVYEQPSVDVTSASQVIR